MDRVLLFDLDGTLTEDHEPHFAAARDMAFADAGHPIHPDLSRRAQAENLYIPALTEIVVPVLTAQLRAQLIRTLYAATDSRYDAFLATSAAWRDGAADVLAAHAERPHAIVTGSWPRNVRAMRRRLPELDAVRVIVTSEDSQPRQKPDPYGLEIAAERLGVPLEECAYVGDHWKDMEAARRAGIPGVLLRTEVTGNEALKTATHVIRNLRELLGLRI